MKVKIGKAIGEGKRGENEYKAAGEILAAGFGWGIIGVFSRPLSEAGLSVVQITALRCVIVATSMALLLFCTDRDRFRIQIKDGWIFLGMGILSLVCFNVCYFITIEHSTLAAASILQYTAPFFVLLMSAILFHEKMTKRKIAALLLAFAGCMLVSGFTGGQMSRLAGELAQASAMRCIRFLERQPFAGITRLQLCFMRFWRQPSA